MSDSVSDEEQDINDFVGTEMRDSIVVSAEETKTEAGQYIKVTQQFNLENGGYYWKEFYRSTGVEARLKREKEEKENSIMDRLQEEALEQRRNQEDNQAERQRQKEEKEAAEFLDKERRQNEARESRRKEKEDKELKDARGSSEKDDLDQEEREVVADLTEQEKDTEEEIPTDKLDGIANILENHGPDDQRLNDSTSSLGIELIEEADSTNREEDDDDGIAVKQKEESSISILSVEDSDSDSTEMSKDEPMQPLEGPTDKSTEKGVDDVSSDDSKGESKDEPMEATKLKEESSVSISISSVEDNDSDSTEKFKDEPIQPLQALTDKSTEQSAGDEPSNDSKDESKEEPMQATKLSTEEANQEEPSEKSVDDEPSVDSKGESKEELIEATKLLTEEANQEEPSEKSADDEPADDPKGESKEEPIEVPKMKRRKSKSKTRKSGSKTAGEKSPEPLKRKKGKTKRQDDEDSPKPTKPKSKTKRKKKKELAESDDDDDEMKPETIGKKKGLVESDEDDEERKPELIVKKKKKKKDHKSISKKRESKKDVDLSEDEADTKIAIISEGASPKQDSDDTVKSISADVKDNANEKEESTSKPIFMKIMGVWASRKKKSKYAIPLETIGEGKDVGDSPRKPPSLRAMMNRLKAKTSSDNPVPKKVAPGKLQNSQAEEINFDAPYKRPIFKKTKEEKKLIATTVEENVAFKGLEPAQIEPLLDAFETKKFDEGATISRAGQPERFYSIVQSGQVDFYSDGKQVGSAGVGESFGDMALQGSIVQPVSIVASGSETVLLQIENIHFRHIVRDEMIRSEEEKVKLLKTVPLFQHLNDIDLAQLSNAMVPHEFKKGENVTKRFREMPFCIIQKGSVVATDKDMGPGQSIGEEALSGKDKPAKMNATATSDGLAFTIDSESFKKVFGDFERLKRKNEDEKALVS
jgi:CRP-like cAMP-binding protein